MDRCVVGGPRDQAVKGVHLAHQMALAQSPDRRVARHGADGVTGKADQRRAHAHSRGGGGRLHARMPAADNDNVKICVCPIIHCPAA